MGSGSDLFRQTLVAALGLGLGGGAVVMRPSWHRLFIDRQPQRPGRHSLAARRNM